MANSWKNRALALALTGAGVLAGQAAIAHQGDHWPIGGDMLKMSYNGGSANKFIFKSKGQLNINASSIVNDPTEERSTLVVRGTGAYAGSTGIIELNEDFWTRVGPADAPTGWKYKNPSILYGPYKGIQKINLKSGANGGAMQIVAKGIQWPFAIVGPQDAVQVTLTIGPFSFCAEFSEDRQAEFSVNEEGRVSARAALAPGDCAAVCGNGVTEVGEECDDGNLEDADTCSNLCVGCNPADAEFDSTFEGIQKLFFDNGSAYSCANDICHGSAMEGGLDLRDGASHDSLIGIASTIDPATDRVFPGDQDKSMLYLKLAAKTLTPDDDGVAPDYDLVPGTPMPSGGLTMTEDHLEAIRLWIRGGAPETGVVEGTAELLGSCLPEPTPLDIPQPDVPDPSIGTQFAQPGYVLQSQSEVEGCVASYYDLSAPGAVPANMLVDCPGAFPGTNDHGTNAGKCFTYSGNQLFQDAQSHHSIIHIYSGAYDYTDPGWGTWHCYGGPTPGAACNPANAGSCGSGGVCGGTFAEAVACLGYGAPDASTFGNKMPQFSGSQESTADFGFPDGVYSVLPLKGLIVWNSHAFNLTSQDTEMEAWINLAYTNDTQWPAEGLFDSRYIFTQEVPPFEQREYCATHTFAQDTHLFHLFSHTHKRGIRFQMYLPPQTPCGNGGNTPEGYLRTDPNCAPGDLDDLFFENYDYADAVNLYPDPPMVFEGSVANRTIKFCGLFDNGFNDPATVKTKSGSPEPTGSELLPGGPCDDTARCVAGTRAGLDCEDNGDCPGSTCVLSDNQRSRCLGGTNKGEICDGNDAECPGSVCDACTLLGGVTTEDEMFIPIGTFYIP